MLASVLHIKFALFEKARVTHQGVLMFSKFRAKSWETTGILAWQLLL
jgi:hypothetical protein